jgi:hypothetical protein
VTGWKLSSAAAYTVRSLERGTPAWRSSSPASVSELVSTRRARRQYSGIITRL